MATIRLSDKDYITDSKKLTTPDMELAVSNYFGITKNLVVPNVSWGFNIYECDLLVMSKAGYLTEVEIKIGKGDLLVDAKKDHSHDDGRVKFLYFALPEYLEELIKHIPPRAGILLVRSTENVCYPYHVILHRAAIERGGVRKLGIADQFKLARLGAMRVWGLKEKLLKEKKANMVESSNG